MGSGPRRARPGRVSGCIIQLQIMPLTPGTMFGPYEVLSPLGSGGMGEVYRARDTKLGRDVALKVLPDTFAHDPERLARFQREAQLLASLNHPNIGGIYGFEDAADTQALVLELVDGSTLADRLAQGRIAVQEALPLARQIADALEAAHGAGVTHRDVKPANVKVRPDGMVKVLDFGLAKAAASGPAGPSADDLSQSPTLTAATGIGVVMGTAAYMSPEQARGKTVDQRTDIWAFGCVLYEMLTSRPPFHGDTIADTLAGVVDREPDWQALPADVPPAVRTLLRRCLQKDPHERLPHIGAARLEIGDAIAARAPAPVSPVLAAPRRPLGLAARAALLLGVALVAALGWLATRSGPPARSPLTVARVSIDPAPGESWVISPHDPDLAISPDGERIAYIGRREDRNELIVRRLDEFEGLSLGSFGGTVRHPFFSPDGKWVGFVDGNVLKKTAVTGGRAVTVCVLPSYMSGAAWGSDHIITFGTLNTGLFRVSAAGGQPEALPTEAQATGRNARWPETLPGGKAILFAAIGAGGDGEIRVRSLKTAEERVIIPSATFPRYAGTGHLLYVADGALWGVRFDANALEIAGTAEPVVDGVMIKGPPQTGLGAANVAIAASGTLVYRPSGAGAGDASTLVWVDRDGREEPWNLEPRAYGRMQLSPDGSKVAIEVADAALKNTDIWVGDVGGASLSQLTFDPALDEFPVWTPDGARVIFKSSREGGGLYQKRADGTGPAERLLAYPAVIQAYFVTPDGRELVYIRRADPQSGAAGGYFGLRLDGTGTNRQLPLNPGPVAALSPDGRWMAHSSEETGNFEVYVQPFPNPDGAKWRITTGGGRDPVWSRDGTELFFQNDTTMFAAAVTTGRAFAAAPAVALFDGPYVDSNGRWYDVAPDGRFLLIKPGWLSAGRDAPLYVVLNWLQELKQRVPIE
jgi:serine/threonine-protein kinase